MAVAISPCCLAEGVILRFTKPGSFELVSEGLTWKPGGQRAQQFSSSPSDEAVNIGAQRLT